MGCDIHLYSETLLNGEWVADTASTFHTDVACEFPSISLDMSYTFGRNYSLFGLLNSNVRKEWPYSFQAQSFPTDASTEVTQLYACWGEDAHSPSHLSVKELKQKAAELLLYQDSDTQWLLGHLTALIDGLPANPTEAEQRIVFWFDN